MTLKCSIHCRNGVNFVSFYFIFIIHNNFTCLLFFEWLFWSLDHLKWVNGGRHFLMREKQKRGMAGVPKWCFFFVRLDYGRVECTRSWSNLCVDCSPIEVKGFLRFFYYIDITLLFIKVNMKFHEAIFAITSLSQKQTHHQAEPNVKRP